MSITVSIRDLVRNSSIIENYDYVKVVDKRKNEIKGIFLSPKYAKEFQKFLKEKKQKEIDEFMQFVGMVNGEFEDMKVQDIKTKKKEKYYE